MRRNKRKFTTRASAEVGDDRIERLWVEDAQREEIRFSWWPNGKYCQNALIITEDELLCLFEVAIRKRVLEEGFLRRLSGVLKAHVREPTLGG